MPLDPSLASAIDDALTAEAPALTELSRNIHANPELRFEEHKAAAWICELLEARGHKVERKAGGLATAFVARAGKKGGARVAILAEYDALPQIGHACGHNLIAAGGVGAFLAASKVAERAGGEVLLIGTPAEEGGGGKVKLLEAGVFEGIDAAMMFHPFDRDLLAHPALANLWLLFTFKGVPSHASASPHQGKSALTACMDTFRLVDGQRVHFRDGVRVHGYVTNGGQAVNIIPENASCEISVRARDNEELARVRAIVERCARAAAMASDVTVEMSSRKGYLNMINNMTLARRFGEHLGARGRVAREGDTRVGSGSTDMGDVSHAMPSIHPYLAVVDEGGPLIHNHEFVHAAGSERGMTTALDASRALAKTAIELLTDRPLLDQVRAEWQAR
jgi:amidohydrolase